MGILSRVGRPYHVADIDLVNDPDLALYDSFYQACAKLRYSDTVVLSRTLGIDVRSVRRWQEGAAFPKRNGTATLVISWVSNGMPRKVITQAGASAGVL